MSTLIRGCSWVGLLLLAATATTLAAPRQFTMPMVPRGPAMVGDLADPAWQQAAKLTDFVTVDEGRAPEAGTEAYVLCDPRALHVAFVCHEPRMDQLVAETSGHEGPVYADDCVEVVIDPARGQTWVWHWIVNAIGVVWDALETPTQTVSSFTVRPGTEGSRSADHWTRVMRFPFASLGVRPQPGEVWGMNFCRERQAGKREITSWNHAPSGFAVPDNCGLAVFPTAPGSLRLTCPSRGGCSADGNRDDRNVWVIEARNAAAGAARLSLQVTAEAKVLARREVVIGAGKGQTARVAYRVPDQGQPRLRFRVLADGQTAYDTTVPAAPAAYRGPQAWQLPDPLYQELLTTRPPGLRREGALVWGHLNDVSLLRKFARRFAVRYSEAGAYQEHADHRFILIGHGVVRDLSEDQPIARYRIKNAPCPVTSLSLEGVPWILDPRAVDRAVAEVQEVFAGPHPLVFGVFAGDELADAAIKAGADLTARPGDYAYLAQADAEVRREFGGGQWGIPKGMVERDPNPYKWIAFRRWINARLRQRNRRLREVTRRSEPMMPLISVDGGGEPGVYELSAQTDLFDIFTNQHAGRGDPWRCTLGYHTKVMADLTGKEVWPCAHVEHYLVSLTPEETVEELSQVFRNGGTGLHLYLPDTGNASDLAKDTKHCLFGSPRRYHTIMNTLDLLRRMPQVRLPAYGRTAILSNDDTLCAEPYDSPRPYSEQTESCYTFLGPVARSWFRFIDCALALQLPLRARFDTVWVPTARFQRPEIVARLREFVQQGGTLVCADPGAFSTDTFGNNTSAARQELFGVVVGEKRAATTLRPRSSALGGELALPAAAYSLGPAAGVETLATYEDGTPALTSRRLGQGKAILFGSNPLAFSALRDQGWRRFFGVWAKSLGMPTGLDIWRFRFPQSMIWQDPPLPGVCLTNNHVLWREEQPNVAANVDLGGAYKLFPPPEAMPDAAADGAIAFAAGHLTDRRTSMTARKTAAYRGAPYALSASRWLVSWAETGPVTAIFDLNAAHPLREFRLWYCDTLPGVTVEGSADGAKWRRLGQAKGQVAGEDVLSLRVPLAKGAACRYLRATFAARRTGEKLTLVEAEVWGDTER